MKKIVVTIESNDNQVSNAVALLLRKHRFSCNYELEINPEYPLQYKKPLNQPYFADAPIYCMNFYYHFAEGVGQNQQAHFQELEIFARAYTHHIKTIMMNSGQFTERLSATENSALMQMARLGPNLQMDAMRKKLASTAYTPQLFTSYTSSKSSTSPSNENKSKLPYYLCGVGIIIALSAIAAPTGIAIALGCLGTLLFIAGSALCVKDRLSSAKYEVNLDSSPAFT